MTRWVILITLALIPGTAWSDDLWPGFSKSAQFDEQTRWSRLESGVRVMVNSPLVFKAKSRLLVIYATPNGNTIEQTLGCTPAKGLDWRFDIQHVAAQVRRLRELDSNQDIVLAVVQAPKLSWPTFRREQTGAGVIINDLVSSLMKEAKADRIALTGHSGGGSFLFGYINAFEQIPENVTRFVFLDANYAYSDQEKHGDKLLNWLRGEKSRELVVIAYDDREIMLDGKKVVGPDGGTYRASHRMLNRFQRDLKLTEQEIKPFRHWIGQNGQFQIFLHPNPENKILHTALVGDMNGLLQGLTLKTTLENQWGHFGGPRAYERWIQLNPDSFIDSQVRLNLPERPKQALTGTQFRDTVAALSRQEREKAIAREILSGNIPSFLRQLVAINAEFTDNQGVKHTIQYHVTKDYLAIGNDEDFFRIPMNPHTANTIAKASQCSMITAKISDDVFNAATIKLDPKPLVKDRESVLTFFEHHQIIENQLQGKGHESLVVGIKKDVVLTNRLLEKPNKVAIYGWHYPNGKPIQPLYVGHVDWYVDYSHGIRLMAENVLVDGKPTSASNILHDPILHPLLSKEGPHKQGIPRE